MGANQHSVNQFYMSPIDRLDFSPISDMELERDDSQQKDSDIQWSSFLVGLFDQKEVSHYSGN